MSSKLIIDFKTERGYDLKLNTGLFINNEFVSGSSRIDTINPANGKPIAKVEAAGEKEVNDAVNAAEQAFRNGWSRSAPQQRRDLLFKLAELVERDVEELAQIETLNSGKAITVARHFDLVQTAEIIRYNASWADKMTGQVQYNDNGLMSFTRLEPLGVCAGIIPWNFPLVMLVFKISSALATGNTIVIKTSEITPLSALKLAALMKEAGIPAGVVNIITGYGNETGEFLTRHKKVRKIAFTGSVPVGYKIMQAAAETNIKSVTLELGGKSPNIIFNDADIEQAIKWAHRGIYFNQGQVCTAGSRIYVQEGIYDEFLTKFKKFSESPAIGDPTEETTMHGPQVSKAQYDRVMSYIQCGQEEGATLYLGGKQWGKKGYFIEPTIFTDVKQSMRIVQEEIFGPVVCISKFKDLDEAVEVANGTKYGLAATVFSQDINTCLGFSERVEAGTVWINCTNMLDGSSPLGGYKDSGLGREGGDQLLHEYTQVKSIKINTEFKI